MHEKNIGGLVGMVVGLCNHRNSYPSEGEVEIDSFKTSSTNTCDANTEAVICAVGDEQKITLENE